MKGQGHLAADPRKKHQKYLSQEEWESEVSLPCGHGCGLLKSRRSTDNQEPTVREPLFPKLDVHERARGHLFSHGAGIPEGTWPGKTMTKRLIADSGKCSEERGKGVGR